MSVILTVCEVSETGSGVLSNLSPNSGTQKDHPAHTYKVSVAQRDKHCMLFMKTVNKTLNILEILKYPTLKSNLVFSSSRNNVL